MDEDDAVNHRQARRPWPVMRTIRPSPSAGEAEYDSWRAADATPTKPEEPTQAPEGTP